MTLTARITDNQEGAAGACIYTGSIETPPNCYWSTSFAISPDSTEGQKIFFKTPFQLIPEGDAFNGTYTATVTIPQYSASGNWSIFSAQLADKLGNFTFLNESALKTKFGAEASINNTEDITPSELVNKEQCKKDGWKVFKDLSFKNQGDCVSWLQSDSNAMGNKKK